MTVNEVLVLLAMASTYDAKLNAPTDEERLNKARAWAMAIDNDLSFDVAKQIIIDYYSEHKALLMPADINKAWRARRAVENSKRRHAELMAELKPSGDKTGMPDELRKLLDEIKGRTKP